MVPTVVTSWLDVGWWTILDTHVNLDREKPSSKLMRLATTTILRPKALKYFVLLNVRQLMYQFSQTFLLPFISTDFKWMYQVMSIRDHTFHLDSPGQSVMKRAVHVLNTQCISLV
jgi:hypothetical protein